jgi:formate dehydrogenase alpha subunit
MASENIIVIDGQELPFEAGETILEVATRHGIDIPTLCYMKGASLTGSCRVCVVEVKGARSLVASCAAPAAPNMVVRTETPQVIQARRMNVELLLASGEHNCLVQDMDMDSWTDFQLKTLETKEHQDLCPAYGDCRLQELAVRYQVRAGRFNPPEQRYPIENVNPFIVRDFSRCVLCGRCVQACNEIQVNNAIGFGYRGSEAKIVAKGDLALKDSDCVFCGECVQACPVGAIVPKIGPRPDGAPGEAEQVRTTCGYCGVGCQMYLHVKAGHMTKVTGVEDVGPNYGSLCVRGRFGNEFIHDEGRLTRPLIRENGEHREASWEEALGLVAERLAKIKAAAGPDSIMVLSSARITNEENYLAQKFARGVIGTNNIDHGDRLSHSSTADALATAFGIGAMTNPIADIEESRVILITGSNTTENHPVLSSYVKRAVSFKGAKLIVVDPRRIPITRFAALWLRPKLGTDVAWINGMMHVIIKENLYDEAYVKSRTVGFEDVRKVVEKYTPQYVSEITEVPEDQLIEAARLYAGASAASILYAMGITQNTAGSNNVKSLANLAMLCGNVGIRGGGVNPLRGQNNVQGACDMGALPNVYTGYQEVADSDVRLKMGAAWGIEGLPETPGLTATTMMQAAHKGELKALYIIGENPMVSDPDLNHAKKGLENLDFLVVQDIFLTETARLADVVLPSASFAEKEGTFTNTERKVQRVRRAVAPPGEAREDWQIIADLSGRMGYPMTYDSSRAIMQEIAAVTPSYGGIHYERLEWNGIHWPCTGTDHPGTPCLHVDQFTCGLGVFQAIEYEPSAEVPDDSYPLYLTTGRILYQYHTGSMAMKSEGLNEPAPECFVEISPQDAEAYGVEDGDRLKIRSKRGSIEAKAQLSDKAVAGTVFIPFYYAGAAANTLTHAALDPTSGIPEYKVCAVQIEKP